MDITTLAAELTTDPLGRGYSGMDDQQAADSLNTADRTRTRATMTGSEVLNAVDSGEWAALTAEEKQIVWDVVHLGDINPAGIEAMLLTNVFGAGSTTITLLAAARQETVTRSEELGLGRVGVGNVTAARQ